MRPLIVHTSSKSLIENAETRLTHRIRGTHGHGGLSRTRDCLMDQGRREPFPHLRICGTGRIIALANLDGFLAGPA